MRETKFRAWDTNRNKWVMADDRMALVSDEEEDSVWGYVIAYSPQGTMCLLGDSIGIITQQYIGLKDKNTKESYFDDVLKWRNSTFRIVWDDECACVMLKRLTGTDGMSEIPAHNIKDSEVIGNIYENPELLE